MNVCAARAAPWPSPTEHESSIFAKRSEAKQSKDTQERYKSKIRVTELFFAGFFGESQIECPSEIRQGNGLITNHDAIIAYETSDIIPSSVSQSQVHHTITG
jgi:hypothetical protein